MAAIQQRAFRLPRSDAGKDALDGFDSIVAKLTCPRFLNTISIISRFVSVLDSNLMFSVSKPKLPSYKAPLYFNLQDTPSYPNSNQPSPQIKCPIPLHPLQNL